MVAKLSSVRIITAASGHVGAGDTHSYADISLFEGWRVIDAITRHSYDLARLLQNVYEPYFVLGSDTRNDANIVDLTQGFLVAECCKLRAGHCATWDAQLPCDGGCRDSMVTSDHADLDASRVRFGN